MLDPRFFENTGPVTLDQLAALTGAVLSVPSRGGDQIDMAATLAQAGPGSVSFIADRKFRNALAESRAGAIFAPAALAEAAPAGCVVLVTPTPQGAWAMAANQLHSLRLHALEDGAIHPTAVVDPSVRLSPGVVVGPGAEIGAGTILGAYAVVGPGVTLGRNCVIGAHATVFCALIGDRVSLLAGARIGEQGFGAAAGPKGLVDVPQLGRVILQDGVTVGANSCIDRGAWEDTVVGEDTKLDNLVHVAHNVQMGRHCLAAAFTGISGSVTIGDGVMFGGRAGVRDHVTLGAGSSVGAAAGVMKDIPAGEAWGGMPAKPMRQWLRETAALTRLAQTSRGPDKQGDER
jgi:UDP-3-O-[3-hydroxymyristoyl] glucosamine N-acyltransferase